MSGETLLRLWRWGSALALLGVVQFLVCLVLASKSYAGGTPLSELTVGYSFYGNFLSDLGRTVAWSGAANGTAATLFNTSLVALAIALVPFYLFLPLHAPDRAIPLVAAAMLGIASCAGLAGVGLRPYDVDMRGHVIALLWWIVPLLLTLMLHAWATLTSEECPRWLALVSLSLAVLVALYALRTAAYGLPPYTAGRIQTLAASIALQKYVLFGCLAWYAVFSLRMLWVMRRPAEPADMTRDVAAAEYLRRLGG